MTILTRNFHGDASPAWTWPVRMRLIGLTEEQQRQVARLPLTGRFSRMQPEVKGGFQKVRVNLLVILAELPDVIDRLSGSRYCSDAVILCEPPGRDTPAGEEIWERVMQIREITNSTGVFLISPATPPEVWLETLYAELSHNRNLPEALQRLTDNGLYFFDTRLERNTRLEGVVEGLVDRLKKAGRESDQAFQIPSRLTEGYSRSALEWAWFLESASPGFGYQHESGEADAIADISNRIDEQFPEETGEFPAPCGAAPAPPSRPLRSLMRGIRRKTIEPLKNIVRRINVRKSDPGGLQSVLPDASDDEMTPPQKMAPPEETAPLEAAAPPEGAAARFLQAKITEETGKVPRLDFLTAGKLHTLHCRIGYPGQGWLEDASAPVQDDMVFSSPHRVLEPIRLLFRSNTDSTLQSSVIELPRTGVSSTALFRFDPGMPATTFQGEVFAYHRNRLLQVIGISAPVGEGPGAASDAQGIRVKILYCLKKDLSNLGLARHFNVSIFYDPESTAGNPVPAMAGGEPVSLYFSGGLGQIVQEIKKEIENTVLNIGDFPEMLEDRNNIDLLIRLAYQGNSLYVNHLKKDARLKGPIQIVSKVPGFVPLDFVYTLPPPAPDAGLCPHAKAALKGEPCTDCFDRSLSVAPYVCPLGFWCFSQVIERYTRPGDDPGDYTLLSEPTHETSTLEVLRRTLFATSGRIEAAVPGLRLEVAEMIGNASAGSYEARDWTEWERMTGQHQPDCMILICHTEKNKALNVEQIEIGDGKFLLQNFFDAAKVRPAGDNPPPFMIVLGCETTDIGQAGFDISSQLMNHGAAIVVSNFTKIRGRQAVPILRKLIGFLQENRGREFPLGEIVLRLKQYLLSEGIMVGLALTTLGDADWKLKL